MNNKKLTLSLLALVACCLTACTPQAGKPDTNPTFDAAASPRVVLLNEGIWGSNNASLSMIDNQKGELANGWFDEANGRGLGDVAQDIVLYGSKLYAVVSESGSLEVIDTASGKSQRVDLGNRYPRYIATDGGYLYISCYNPHSVIRIDTATLAIGATCLLGDYHPEGMAIAGGRLFVASSNVSDAQGTYSYDSVIYVVELSEFDNPQAIVVGHNPQLVARLDNSHLVVNYWGDYGEHPAGSTLVDANTLSVVQLDAKLSNMTVHQGLLYGYISTYSSDYSSKTTEYVTIDANATVTPILPDCAVDRPYGIGVDPRNGDILIATDGNYSSTGSVYCYTRDGELRWKQSAGYFPSKFIFLP